MAGKLKTMTVFEAFYRRPMHSSMAFSTAQGAVAFLQGKGIVAGPDNVAKARIVVSPTKERLLFLGEGIDSTYATRRIILI